MTEFEAAGRQLLFGHGVWALLALLVLQEAGVPVFVLPGYLLLAWVGFLWTAGEIDPLPVVLLTPPAVTAGACALYGACYRWGPPRWLGGRAVLPAGTGRIPRLAGWLQRRGVAAVLLGRLVPGLRVPTCVVSGSLHLPWTRFVGGTAVAAALWTMAYFGAGAAAGAAWHAQQASAMEVQPGPVPAASGGADLRLGALAEP